MIVTWWCYNSFVSIFISFITEYRSVNERQQSQKLYTWLSSIDSWIFIGWLYIVCHCCVDHKSTMAAIAGLFNIRAYAKYKFSNHSNPAHGEVYSIQNYVIQFVSDLRHVGGFLRASLRVSSNNKNDLYDIAEI